MNLVKYRDIMQENMMQSARQLGEDLFSIKTTTPKYSQNSTQNNGNSQSPDLNPTESFYSSLGNDSSSVRLHRDRE